jgi:hypothetical protein
MRESKMVPEVEIRMVNDRELERTRNNIDTISLRRKKRFLTYVPALSQDGTVWR